MILRTGNKGADRAQFIKAKDTPNAMRYAPRTRVTNHNGKISILPTPLDRDRRFVQGYASIDSPQVPGGFAVASKQGSITQSLGSPMDKIYMVRGSHQDL